MTAWDDMIYTSVVALLPLPDQCKPSATSVVLLADAASLFVLPDLRIRRWNLHIYSNSEMNQLSKEDGIMAADMSYVNWAPLPSTGFRPEASLGHTQKRLCIIYIPLFLSFVTPLR